MLLDCVERIESQPVVVIIGSLSYFEVPLLHINIATRFMNFVDIEKIRGKRRSLARCTYHAASEYNSAFFIPMAYNSFRFKDMKGKPFDHKWHKNPDHL